MRKEPFTIGDYIHVYNRGNKKMPIIYNESDRWRFLRCIRYFNDEYARIQIFRELAQLQKSNFCRPFEWPNGWPPHRPLVKILAYHLTENHFHLLLKETIVGGVTKFMRKLGTGFTNYINIKYEETGKIFQGSYKSRTIKDEKYLQYLDAYIQVLNPLELYPGGIEKALKDFDKAFEFAMNYPFCSLGENFGKRNLGIIDRDILRETFPNLEAYKKFAYDALILRNAREILGRLVIER